MTTTRRYDVVVIGAGPNGLTAAVMLARAGLAVLVVEAANALGGGARTAELTLPGFRHDVCSAVHPLGAASPIFRRLGLEKHGLEWVESPSPLVHLLPDGRPVALERSIEATAAQLGADARAYQRLVAPMAEQFDSLVDMFLGPLRFPRRPILAARFGLRALRSMQGLARAWFKEDAAPALLAGIAAHAMLPLDTLDTASFGLVLGLAGHAVGWPIARGGSQAIADALVAELLAQGGDVLVDHPVKRLADLPSAEAYVFDMTPAQLLTVTGDVLPPRYRKRLGRYRYGAGVFKIDWALSGPVPWREPKCLEACTIHLSGTLADIAASEAAVHHNRLHQRPFVLFVQPSLFDATRAPPGQHTAWAYCHVPIGSAVNATDIIESHVERFAPGFRDRILARATKTATEMQAYNANYVGGDISGGASDLGQLFFRPVARLDPYATPVPNFFLCSSSTPPGGGVHGLCGYFAAQSVLKRVFNSRAPARALDPSRSASRRYALVHAPATQSPPRTH